MRFPPSLTLAELKELSEKSAPGSTERRLLWEIKRLRAVALRADQLLRSIKPLGGAGGMIYDSLRHELNAEACIRERRMESKDIFSQDGSKK